MTPRACRSVLVEALHGAHVLLMCRLQTQRLTKAMKVYCM